MESSTWAYWARYIIVQAASMLPLFSHKIWWKSKHQWIGLARELMKKGLMSNSTWIKILGILPPSPFLLSSGRPLSGEYHWRYHSKTNWNRALFANCAFTDDSASHWSIARLSTSSRKADAIWQCCRHSSSSKMKSTLLPDCIFLSSIECQYMQMLKAFG